MVQDTDTFLTRRVFRNGMNTYIFKENGFPDFVKNNKQIILDILHYNNEYNGEHKKIVDELKSWFNGHNSNDKDNNDLDIKFSS